MTPLWLWLAFGPGARAGSSELRSPAGVHVSTDDEPPFDRWQTAKGLTVALALVGVFLFTDWPRDVAALVGAGVLLLSRRLHSAHVMGFVDWQLLLLFIGLFVVNHAFETTGLAAEAVAWLATQGVHLTEPGALLVLGVALSNLVSNVPAVMLLLPHLGANASEAELGRMLLPAWQQQGLGTQLSRLLIAQAGCLGGIETLSKRIQQQNLAALHSAAKLGFKVSAELADGFLRLSRPLKLNPAEESRK